MRVRIMMSGKDSNRTFYHRASSVYIFLIFLLASISNSYVIGQTQYEPDALSHDQNQNTLYIGYRNYPGIGIYDIKNSKLTETLSLP